MQPIFPFTVHFEDGDIQRFDTADDLADTLEWFDTEGTLDAMTDVQATVRDAQGPGAVAR